MSKRKPKPEQKPIQTPPVTDSTTLLPVVTY